MSNTNTAIALSEYDQAYCLIYLVLLKTEIKSFPRFIDSKTLYAQLEHCIDKVKKNLTDDARMSLYQVQNRLAELCCAASTMKSNIAYMRSLLACTDVMSKAGRPLGHTLAPKAAEPYRIDKKGGAI